jgi:hypothetical protein
MSNITGIPVLKGITGIPVLKGRGFIRAMSRLLFAAALAAEGRFPAAAKQAAEKSIRVRARVYSCR